MNAIVALLVVPARTLDAAVERDRHIAGVHGIVESIRDVVSGEHGLGDCRLLAFRAALALVGKAAA